MAAQHPIQAFKSWTTLGELSSDAAEHASVMEQLGVDPKWGADQLGHSLDVSQNIYAQVPVEQRL